MSRSKVVNALMYASCINNIVTCVTKALVCCCNTIVNTIPVIATKADRVMEYANNAKEVIEESIIKNLCACN